MKQDSHQRAPARDRRRCIATLATLGLTTLRHRAVAQPAGKPVVGVLTPASQQWHEAAFRQRLRELGYVEGVNLEIDVRSADARLERLHALAEELVRTRPDVIVAVNTPGTRAALDATRSIPIVMAVVGDPVGQGFVKTLARPGGNATGVSNQAVELAAKRLGLLLEAVPKATRIALLHHPDEPIVGPQLQGLETSRRKFGLSFRTLGVRTIGDLVQALDEALAWRAQALLRLAGQGLTLGPQTAVMALEKKLPSMLLTARDVEAGALMSYFMDDDSAYRRVAEYVHRILQGSAPDSLPVEQPTQFELVLNARTAQTLGLSLPPALLIQATRVIR